MANPAENNVKNESPAQENKMGVMPVGKLLFTMSLPIMISMLVQALYNVVDSMFVARVSENALTALSMAFPIQNLMIAVSTGLGVGLNAVLSRALGAKDEKGVNRAATNGIILLFICGLVFMLGGATIVRPYFEMQTDIAEIVESGVDYTTIVMVGSMGIFMQILFERLLQSTGRTLLTMVSQGVGAIANIILDPIFIFALGMGVRGAALATVLSQGLSCAWVLVFLCGKKAFLRLRRENLFVSPKLILPCVALGLATFTMQASESVISVCFNASLLKYGGDIAVGAMTILTSVMQFAMLPLQGIGQGAQPITSYNFGAKNTDRVRETFRLLLKVCLIYSVSLWLLIELFPGLFARIFTPDAELIAFTARVLRIYCAGLFLFGIQIACQMTFISMGNAKASVFLAVFRKFILLIPLIYLLPALLPDKAIAVYLAEPIADTIAVLCTALLFRHEFKKALQAISEPLQEEHS